MLSHLCIVGKLDISKVNEPRAYPDGGYGDYCGCDDIGEDFCYGVSYLSGCKQEFVIIVDDVDSGVYELLLRIKL